MNLEEWEAAGHFLRRKDASPQKPSVLYSMAEVLEMWKKDRAVLAKIESLSHEYFDQESGPGISPAVQRGLDYCTSIMSTLEHR